jgi:predicted flap endonuclease-1-like 5' DNA nuclease
MGFLLIKILGLLGLAAACGAGAAYWWFRRHYEDVTLEYARGREEWDAWRRNFEERLSSRPAVNLEPIAQQLAGVQAAVGAIEIPEPPDLSSTDQRLTAIEHALFPVQTRLDELTGAIRALRAPPAPPPPTPEPDSAPPKAPLREGSRNLLTHPAHGQPDDLTQIKGLPKVLEHTLHEVGVFYFWQIAEWSPEDVEYVDSQLEDFQGRIEADWVSQAGELATLPSAAPRPTEH